MKQGLEHVLLASILLFLFLLIKGTFTAIALVLILTFYQLRTRDRTIFFMALILALSFIPHARTGYPAGITDGRVIKVSSASCIVASHGYRFQMFSDEVYPYGTQLTFTGSFHKITGSPHFFSMDFADYDHRQGIYYAITPETVTVTKKSSSFQAVLYRSIAAISDEKKRSLCFKVLLGISDENSDDSFLYRSGFSLSGLLAILDRLLGWLVNEKKRNRIVLAVGILLMILYGFPLILFQAVLFRILRSVPLRKDQQLGIGFIIIMLVYPVSVKSAAFLLPASFRLVSIERKERRLKAYYLSLLLQSYLFQGFNPVLSLVFSSLRLFLGAGWFLALGTVFFSSAWLLKPLEWMDQAVGLLDRFDLPGSVYGCGFLFYAVLLFLLRHQKHFLYKAIAFLLLFQIGGFFHPFMEISFINVGQGDSIFIKEPFNRHGVLIDTGKPNQAQNVSSFLKAKGIKKLDAMLITHGDNDHSGGMDELSRKFSPDQLVTGHFHRLQADQLVFYDLNEIVSADENQSSLVLYTKLNGMNILLMADADQVTEETIVQKYGLLHADVLKLSHHGSKTGSCDRFLDTVRPHMGIISSGAYRIYHHPSPETLQRLLKRHIPWLDTKTEGDITIICLPHLNLGMTASGKLGIMNCDDSISDLWK